VAEDGVDHHPAAGRVAGVGPAGAGQHRAAAGVDVGQVELPGRQALQGGQHGRGRPAGGKGPEQGDPRGVGVEPAGVGAEHGPGDAAVAALEHAAVAVDQEVVADVVPAPGAHVIQVVGPDQGGVLRGRVAVALHGVMHEGGLHGVAVVRVGPPDPLVSPPPGPAHDPRLHGRRRRHPGPRRLGPRRRRHVRRDQMRLQPTGRHGCGPGPGLGGLLRDLGVGGGRWVDPDLDLAGAGVQPLAVAVEPTRPVLTAGLVGAVGGLLDLPPRRPSGRGPGP
jgi:hypothetical protein